MKKYYLLMAVLVILSIVFAQGVKYIVDPKICIGCTICVTKCPVKAIEMKENKAVIDVSKCIGCGLCAANCPVKAISIRKAVEPANSVQDSAAVKAIPDSLKKDKKPVKVPDREVILPDSTRKVLPDSLKKVVKPITPVPEKKVGAEIKTPPAPVRIVYKVDAESCIGCKICIGNCPVNAIEYKSNKAIIDAGKCIGCGLCAAGCPVKSIAKS